MKTIVEIVNLIHGRALKQRDSRITWLRVVQHILVMFYSVFAGSVELQFWKYCLQSYQERTPGPVKNQADGRAYVPCDLLFRPRCQPLSQKI